MSEDYIKGVNDTLDSIMLACDASMKKARELDIEANIGFDTLKKMIQSIKDQANQQVKEILNDSGDSSTLS